MRNSFVVWKRYLIFFVTCTFSESAVTTNRDVITTPVSPYKVRSENRILAFGENKLDNNSLNSRQNPAKSTKTDREYFIYSNNFQRTFRTTISLFSEYNQKLSKLTDGQHTTSSSTQLFDRPNEIEIYHQCYTNDDCKKRLKLSICSFLRTGNACVCLGGYIKDGLKCIKEAYLGEYCEESIQCPLHSICKNEECTCMSGYINRDYTCENKSLKPPNFFLALVAGIVFLIVVACLLVIIMGLRRKLIRARGNEFPADIIPTVSTMMDARQPGLPNPSYQQIDKPPPYDEAISSSTTLLTLSVEDVTSQPPTYTQVLQNPRSSQSSLAS